MRVHHAAAPLREQGAEGEWVGVDDDVHALGVGGAVAVN